MGICFAGCNSTGLIEINNPSKDTSILIVSESKAPSVFRFKLNGKIDDTCKINGTNYGPGKLDEEVFLDQYNDTLYLKYKAYKVKNGEIRIAYDFN